MSAQKQNVKSKRYDRVKAAAIRGKVLADAARAEVRETLQARKSERGQGALIALVALAVVVIAVVLILGPVFARIWAGFDVLAGVGQ